MACWFRRQLSRNSKIIKHRVHYEQLKADIYISEGSYQDTKTPALSEMGGYTPPAPLIPFIQLFIIICLPLIPLHWILLIVAATKSIYRGHPIAPKVKDVRNGILATIFMPVFISVFLWVMFFAQVISYLLAGVFYLGGFIQTQISDRTWPLVQEMKATYPLTWYDTEYIYFPLGRQLEIRLLVLHPGRPEDPLEGDIVGTDLRRRPKYDAVSYTWADESGDDHLSSAIHCLTSDSKISITRNCEAALKRLRLPNKRRKLWVDAVCINQHSDTERSQQVSLMSEIYKNARSVIAYTGEGTDSTDLLYDWLNGIDVAELNIPSGGMFKDIDVAENSILHGPAQIWNKIGGAKDWANEISIKFERYWRIGSARLSMVFQPRQKQNVVISDDKIGELVSEYLSRRWFKRVWVLQEVSLPTLSTTRVMCGSKITTAERAIHLVSLLKNQGSSSMTWFFILCRQRISGPRISHLLDILIETRHRECTDPRDKIFGVLSIARWMDEGRFPQLQANYGETVHKIYIDYSEFFIRHHGVGFFLALLKQSYKSKGLPSWAADWSAPWLNYNAVCGIDFAARSRASSDEDGGAQVMMKDGLSILSFRRPRIVRGYITKNGHFEEARFTDVEKVQSLDKDELLVETYPGVAALLKNDGEYYNFVQVCPHALSRVGVEDLVGRWNRVVVYMEGPKNQTRKGTDAQMYLTDPEYFNIW